MSYGHSEAYSKDEFVAYALEQNLGPDAGLQMWNEAVPLEEDVPNYGNWGGIAVSLPSFVCIIRRGAIITRCQRFFVAAEVVAN